MGEEKPDEELMGKRKLAPRLSTTFVVSIITGCPWLATLIHMNHLFIYKSYGSFLFHILTNFLFHRSNVVL